MHPEIISEMHDFGEGNGPVLAHRHPNGGGWVAETATVDRTAFVGPGACVFQFGRVLDRAIIVGTAWVLWNAEVSGNARVSDDAEVNGHARVREDAQVGGGAFISDSALIEGHAVVGGTAHILDAAVLNGQARVVGEAEISGDVVISDDLQLPPMATMEPPHHDEVPDEKRSRKAIWRIVRFVVIVSVGATLIGVGVDRLTKSPVSSPGTTTTNPWIPITVNGCIVEPNADCPNANLSNYDLAGADLTHANLSGANLSYDYFSVANLSGANLTNANMNGDELWSPNGQTLSDVASVTWSNTTCPDDTNSNNDNGTCANNLTSLDPVTTPTS
jgi:carbonic anhydrase/acetyltransferase-like protein (isoleucine patch superfamily)